MEFADSLTLMMPRRASAHGGSTQCLVPANRDTRHGKENRGKSAARRRGLRGLTIPRPTLLFGLSEILRLRIAARAARATISTAIHCWRLKRRRASSNGIL